MKDTLIYLNAYTSGMTDAPLALNDLGDYLQCITCNANMTNDKELKNHSNNNCVIIPMEFKIKKVGHKRMNYISKRVQQEYGILKYRGKPKYAEKIYSIPKGDMILVGDIDRLIKEMDD